MQKGLDEQLFAIYNYCMLKRSTGAGRAADVRDFRRDLRVLERELMRQLEGETACCGVTLAQCHALLELSFAELSLRGLAAAVDLDTSTLSRTVDGLVKAGLVQRTEDPVDRRSVRLALTPAGVDKVATIDGMCDRYYRDLFLQLNQNDQRCVVRAVKILAHVMRDRRRPPSGGQVCCTTLQASTSRGRRPRSDRAGKEISK